MKRSSGSYSRALGTLVLGVLFKVYFCIALRKNNGQEFYDCITHIFILPCFLFLSELLRLIAKGIYVFFLSIDQCINLSLPY